MEKQFSAENISNLSDNEIVDLAASIRSLSEGYFKERDNLEKIVVANRQHIINVPPDGDCLYYSVVETMERENIYPLNFNDGDEDGQLSRERVKLLLIAGNASEKGEILRKASIELRNMVADKLAAAYSR